MDKRPKKLYGCEVWRDLGWMQDEEKIVFDVSKMDSIQNALVAVFDSQVSGGKRYDLATMGRRVANATYFTSHATDNATGLSAGTYTVTITDNNSCTTTATANVSDQDGGSVERRGQND